MEVRGIDEVKARFEGEGYQLSHNSKSEVRFGVCGGRCVGRCAGAFKIA